MCEKFKEHVIEKINEELKKDAYYVKLLETNMGIFVHDCSFRDDVLHSEYCKKIYVRGISGMEEGFQCTICKKYTCKGCSVGKRCIGGKCVICWKNTNILAKPTLIDKVIHCKYCKGTELSYVDSNGTDNFYCKGCDSIFSLERMRDISGPL
jgi:hypothetical protein